MLRLTNISIPARIAIACLLALPACVGFAGNDLVAKRPRYSKSARIAELAGNAEEPPGRRISNDRDFHREE